MFGVKYLGYALVFFRQPTGVAALALAIGSLALLWGLFFPDEAASTTEAAAGELVPGRNNRLARHAAIPGP